MSVKESTFLPELASVSLRDQVEGRIRYVSDLHLQPGKPKYFVARTLLHHLDDLNPILWSEPRSRAEINAVTASSYSAFHRAYKYDTWENLYDEGLSSMADYERVWSNMLDNGYNQRIITKSFWEKPTSYAPSRTPVFYHIINDFFEKPENHQPLVIVDLGSGPAHTIPTLNTARDLVVKPVGIPIADELVSIGAEIPIAAGISVDKDDRNFAIVKALLNTEDPVLAESLRSHLYRKIYKNKNSMVEIVTDIAQYPEVCYKSVTKWANRLSGRGNADVILSSFFRYQLPTDSQTQDDYWQLITRLLREGGILIEVGNELVIPQPQMRYNVHVFEKKDGNLVHRGIPFVIDDEGKVLAVDQSYFT